MIKNKKMLETMYLPILAETQGLLVGMMRYFQVKVYDKSGKHSP